MMGYKYASLWQPDPDVEINSRAYTSNINRRSPPLAATVGSRATIAVTGATGAATIIIAACDSSCNWCIHNTRNPWQASLSK